MTSKAKIKPKYYSVEQLDFNCKALESAAVEAVKKLTEAGFKAYLVGGCVRDILLGKLPKDFDISTNATPPQVRRIFPRSRIIGQRFKIVHATVRGELLEITTFRRAVKAHHKDKVTGQVLDDNVFGSIEEDASRRDFSINALYYDVNAKQVLDYFQGVEDLKRKRLSLIGEPEVRFTEDPGRLLRTVRFQAKFDFEVDESLVNAIGLTRHALLNIPPARRFDELVKLFYCGKARRMWQLLNDYDLLPYLFAYADDPDCENYDLSKEITSIALKNTDTRIGEGKPVISAFMFCAILWPYYQHEFSRLLANSHDPQEAMTQASEMVISRQLHYTGMLRRVSNTIREIWWLQFRLSRNNKRSVMKLLSHPRFRAAYDFLLIRAEVGDVDPQLADFWTKQQQQVNPQNNHKPQKNKAKNGNHRSRSRNHRRRG